MTLEDFKDVYKDKTPVEMLDLLAEQHATWRHDAIAREENRDSIDGGAYYANECRAMEARVEWLMGHLKDALKEQEPVEPQFVQDVNGAYAACGKCNHKLWKLFGAEFTVAPSEMPRFCSSCGQAVKWE